jgi:hypothetical protein
MFKAQMVGVERLTADAIHVETRIAAAGGVTDIGGAPRCWW